MVSENMDGITMRKANGSSGRVLNGGNGMCMLKTIRVGIIMPGRSLERMNWHGCFATEANSMNIDL